MRELYVIAGPNGSGKSTLVASLVKHNHGDFFSTYPYICPDTIANQFPFNLIEERDERNRKAADEAQRIRDNYVRKGQSFMFETVFSTPAKLHDLQVAKDAGYLIHFIFVTLNDPAKNVERVAKRMEDGGHDVDTDAILRRYPRCMNNLVHGLLLSDDAIIYDNTVQYRLVMTKEVTNSGASYVLYNRAECQPWVTSSLLIPLESKGIEITERRRWRRICVPPAFRPFVSNSGIPE